MVCTDTPARQENWTRGLKRNLAVDRALHRLLRPVFRRIFHYTYTPYTPKSDVFLLAANHTMDVDPFLECMAVDGYIRFVAAENIFQFGPISRLIVFLIHPIRKRKGARSGETVRAIEENLRLGVNVGIHVEGNKSFTGRSGFISPRTGQMIKEAQGGLITFRITGGYMQKPRWARFRRRGPAHGAVVREYTRQELDAMTAEEINEALRRDLFVDACAMQRENQVAYPGRALAEHLETALYACPACGRLQTMKSRDDAFFCTACGYGVRMDAYGFFHGTPQAVFDCVPDWDAWQRERLRACAAEARDDVPVLQSAGQMLYRISGGKKRRVLRSGQMCLYRDRIVFSGGGKTVSLPLREITGMAVFLKTTLLITAADGRWQVTSRVPHAAVAYFAAYRYLTGKEYL